MAKFLSKAIFTATIILTLAGCTTQALPESWDPLTTLVERGDLPGVGDTVVTTVSPNLYVRDIDDFLERYPEGSVQHEALRRHEVEHAKEQEEFVGDATGIKRQIRMSIWLKRYLTDKKFRLEVEKRGYKAEILYERSRGVYVPPEVYALILSGKTYGNMISYEEALEWVRKVYRGQA
jgi:hypothetical protein